MRERSSSAFAKTATTRSDRASNTSDRLANKQSQSKIERLLDEAAGLLGFDANRSSSSPNSEDLDLDAATAPAAPAAPAAAAGFALGAAAAAAAAAEGANRSSSSNNDEDFFGAAAVAAGD